MQIGLYKTKWVISRDDHGRLKYWSPLAKNVSPIFIERNHELIYYIFLNYSIQKKMNKVIVF
jgi:hypothetical protein